MALVHVVNVGATSERVQKMDAAETEHGLLTEAVEGVAAVEVVGEGAVPGVVAFDVGVEEEDGDDVAGDADGVKAPGTDLDVPAVHEDVDRLSGAGKRGLGDQGTSLSVCWPLASRCWRK